MGVKHAATATLPDIDTGDNEGAVHPSDWNDDHVQDSGGILGALAAGATVVLSAAQFKAFVLAVFGWQNVSTAGDKTTATLANGKVSIIEFNTPE